MRESHGFGPRQSVSVGYPRLFYLRLMGRLLPGLILAACGSTPTAISPPSSGSAGPVAVTLERPSGLAEAPPGRGADLALSGIYQANGTDVTLTDVALVLALFNQGSASGEAEALAGLASALLGVAIASDSLVPVPTQINADYVQPGGTADGITLEDVAVVLAASNLPLAQRTPAQVTAVANALLGAERIQVADLVAIPGVPPLPGTVTVSGSLVVVPGLANDDLTEFGVPDVLTLGQPLLPDGGRLVFPTGAGEPALRLTFDPPLVAGGVEVVSQDFGRDELQCDDEIPTTCTFAPGVVVLPAGVSVLPGEYQVTYTFFSTTGVVAEVSRPLTLVAAPVLAIDVSRAEVPEHEETTITFTVSCQSGAAENIPVTLEVSGEATLGTNFMTEDFTVEAGLTTLTLPDCGTPVPLTIQPQADGLITEAGTRLTLSLLPTETYQVAGAASRSTVLIQETDHQIRNLSDEDEVGAGSLRSALEAANREGSILTPTLTFRDNATDGTITLASQLEIRRAGVDVTVIGPGRELRISGNNQVRVLRVDADTTAAFANLTLEAGLAGTPEAPNGGAIRNDGTLTLMDVAIANSTATLMGGGIFNQNQLTLVNSLITGNRARQEGGGLMNLGTATLTGSNIRENEAGTYGGGSRNEGQLNFSGSGVTANQAAGNGGGIDNAGGTINLSTSEVTANQAGGSGGGINNFEGSLQVTKSSIATNTSIMGGGIHNLAGTVMITGGGIADNTVTENGGGIANNQGQVAIDDSRLTGNTAATGGGLFNADDLSITGSAIDSNTAVSGGGFFNQGTATIDVSNITGNFAEDEGGGLINAGTLALSGSSLEDNTATDEGGGLSNFPEATATLTGNGVRRNTATFGGGGGIRNSGDLTINGGDFTDNTAGGDGGGLDNVGLTGTLAVTGSVITGNSSTGSGGGLNTYQATSTVTESVISNNRAGENGGGITNSGAATLTLSFSELTGNQAADDGGGIANFASTLTLTGNRFDDNNPNNVFTEASDLGGGTASGNSPDSCNAPDPRC